MFNIHRLQHENLFSMFWKSLHTFELPHNFLSWVLAYWILLLLIMLITLVCTQGWVIQAWCKISIITCHSVFRFDSILVFLTKISDLLLLKTALRHISQMKISNKESSSLLSLGKVCISKESKNYSYIHGVQSINWRGARMIMLVQKQKHSDTFST